MSNDKDIAILGAGMHPWGKWGHNFVEYGVIAAQNALADANVEWRDIQFVSGADTMRNGYPGYVSGATTIPTGCGSACSAPPTRRTSACTHVVVWRCTARRVRTSPG
jgi:acetyl-CoA acetyltransferase